MCQVGQARCLCLDVSMPRKMAHRAPVSLHTPPHTLRTASRISLSKWTVVWCVVVWELCRPPCSALLVPWLLHPLFDGPTESTADPSNPSFFHGHVTRNCADIAGQPRSKVRGLEPPRPSNHPCLPCHGHPHNPPAAPLGAAFAFVFGASLIQPHALIRVSHSTHISCLLLIFDGAEISSRRTLRLSLR